MSRKKLDENDYKTIIQLKQNGYTNQELADIFNITKSRIGQILRSNGINSTNSKYLNFSEDDCQNIIDLYKQGVSSVNIGKIFGCSKNPITRVLHDNGIILDTSLRKINKSDYQKIADMYTNGMTQQEIADIYQCSQNTISRVMQNIGLSVRPNGLTKEQVEQMYELYKKGFRLPQIADIYNVDRHTIGRAFKKNGFVTDRKTYHCDEHYFDNINTQDKAYIIGLLWADGCNQLERGIVTIQLQERDQKILEQSKNVSCNERPLHKTELNNRNPNWQNSIRLTWQSRHMAEILNNYGMVPRKSLVLEFPDWLDESLYPHFIRGYMDGDGSIYYSQQRNVFRASMIGTKMFVDIVKDICEKVGVKTSLYHKNEHNDITYNLYTTSNSGTFTFLNWIYKDANLKLERKYNKYQQALKNYNIDNSLVS